MLLLTQRAGASLVALQTSTEQPLRHHGGAAVNVIPLVQTLEMGVDGPGRHAEPARDLLVGVAIGDE